MHDRERGVKPFAYALLRVVPHVERGECVNAGVVLFCRQYGYLDLLAHVDATRLAALAVDLDPAPVRSRMAALSDVARGDARAGALARLPAAERFGWLVAPSSTIIQPSEVHAGLTDDPAATLEHLLLSLVR